MGQPGLRVPTPARQDEAVSTLVGEHMNQTTPQSETLTLSLEPRDRKRAMLFVWMCPVVLLVLVTGWALQIWMDYSPDVDADHSLVGFSLVVLTLIVGGLGCGYFLYFAHSFGWYACEFRVSPESIEWIFPEGRVIAGQWSGLKYVSAENRLLYFADGSKIPLRFGPGPKGEIPKHTMKAILVMSGQTSILTRAFGELEAVAMPDRRRSDRISLITVSFVLFFIPMVITLLFFVNGVSKFVAFGFGLSLFACPLAFLVLKHVIRTRAVEKQYGPPKGHPSVRWHRQF